VAAAVAAAVGGGDRWRTRCWSTSTRPSQQQLLPWGGSCAAARGSLCWSTALSWSEPHAAAGCSGGGSGGDGGNGSRAASGWCAPPAVRRYRRRHRCCRSGTGGATSTNHRETSWLFAQIAAPTSRSRKTSSSSWPRRGLCHVSQLPTVERVLLLHPAALWWDSGWHTHAAVAYALHAARMPRCLLSRPAPTTPRGTHTQASYQHAAPVSRPGT
jgi:hypothetical protein